MKKSIRFVDPGAGSVQRSGLPPLLAFPSKTGRLVPKKNAGNAQESVASLPHLREFSLSLCRLLQRMINNTQMMNIRLSRPEDLPEIMDIFARARRFMAAHGNPRQWINGYPSLALMQQEIADEHCYVCEDEAGVIVGTFCLIFGDDSTYACIEGGAWLNDEAYATIHRLAAKGSRKGIAAACLTWCAGQTRNLRTDTHHDNYVMQNILAKQGFQRCGIIYTHNGTARIAYQKIIGKEKETPDTAKGPR